VDERPEWISMDLKNPEFLTITTYQALHSVFSDREEKEGLQEDGVLEAIDQTGFKTIILDEAHHLRAAWWKSALDFRKRLSQPTVVALTATPPYDVSLAEWQRYIELCGPIDLEISVPELIKEKDLCPHQDYVYMSAPSLEERDIIQSYRVEVDQIMDFLVNNLEFVTIMKNHPWIVEPEVHIEKILESPSYFSSILIFLKEEGVFDWKAYRHILGSGGETLPKLDLVWTEELLTNCLFQDMYTLAFEDVMKEIRKKLSRAGAIERKKVYLRTNKKIDRMLLTSASKLGSIRDIVEFEANNLKGKLRLVILTDYIRMEDMPTSPEDEKAISRLGVIPIFETLRRKRLPEIKLGVLCGSIAILPASAAGALQDSVTGDMKESLRVSPLPHDSKYISIEFTGAHNQQLVRIMTAMFMQGEVHVLTGTTALLGEGWDAPSINSIILASYVGTFMLSNQMRGRAIRVERGNGNKTSTIWHLVCMDFSDSMSGYDMKTLQRRFKGFVGVSHSGETIENGLDRLHLVEPPMDILKLKASNEKMRNHAAARHKLASHWEYAIDRSERKGMVEEMTFLPEAIPKSAIFPYTIRALVIQGIMVGLLTFLTIMDSGLTYRFTTLKTLLIFLLVGLVLSVLVMLPKMIKGLWLWIKYGTVETSAKQIGETVLDTLFEMKVWKTEKDKIKMNAKQMQDGEVHFWMSGGTRQEQMLLLDAMQEIQDPLDNPRYFLKRKSKLGPFRQYDYHAVPQVIARNKKAAEFFQRQWNKRVGKAELIYARTLEGRKELIKARTKSLSATFKNKADRISVWR
jgi:superfamily II DNA or RNA helicase